MGMTVEDHIAQLKKLKSFHNGSYGASIRVAIDIMRKYQQVEQIVSDFREYQKGISCGFGGATYMQMVSEVVENGNDDNQV